MSDFPTEFLEVVLAEYGVTEAGLEVLLPTLKGKTAKTVADTLGISPAAVRKRISEAYQKIGISDDKPGPGKLKELKTLLSEKYNSFPKVANQLSPGMTSAPDVPVFCGRKDELNTLTHWIVNERCRLITILGMGGIGKTALAVKFVEQLKQKSKVEFEDDYIIWHSLSDGSPLKETLKKLLSFFPEVKTSDSLKEMIAFFIRDCLQKHRCLIILDNAESVIGSNQPEDGTEYEEYCEFLLQISETQSRSCIILTSREKPLKIASLEGGKRPVRSLQISGLSEEDAYNLFKTDNSSPNLDSSEVAISKIVSSYAGNPFFLKIASTTINSIFDGDVDAFMNEFVKEEAPVFGDIRELLEQQFNRLSTLEEQIMYWLAIEREPISISALRKNLIATDPSNAELLEAIGLLKGRSLVDVKSGKFALHSVIIEYLYTNLIEQAVKEIRTGKLSFLKNYCLMKATSKTFIRRTQERLILQPVVKKLITASDGSSDLENRLKQILVDLPRGAKRSLDYAAGNILNVLCHLENDGFKLDFKQFDFSRLVVRQAYLAEINLSGINLANSDLTDSTLTRVLNSFLAVELSPDGQVIATGDVDGKILLWHLNDEQPYLTLSGHTNWVRAVKFSPNGKFIASCSDDQTIRLWSLSTGECLKIFRGHTNWVWSIAFSPDGKTIASGSSDKTVRIWNLKDDEPCKVFNEHTAFVRAVAFAPDGKSLASASSDRSIRIWDVGSENCCGVLLEHEDAIQSIAFSQDSKTLASGSHDQNIKIWDVNSGKYLMTLTGHTGCVWTVIFHEKDQEKLISCGEDRTIRFWNIQTGTCYKIIHEHEGRIWSISANNNSDKLVSGGDDKTLRIWDTFTHECIQTIRGYNNWVYSVAFSPTDNVIAAGYDDSRIRVWDVNQPNLPPICLQGHTGRVWSVAFSSTGNLLASGSDDGTIRLWEIEEGEARRGKFLKILTRHEKWTRSVAFQPKGSILASCGDDRSIKLWSIYSNEDPEILEGHSNTVRSIAFSPDGQTLISCSDDKNLKLWSVADRNCLKTFEGHEARVWSVSFGSNSDCFASASDDGTIRIWDAKQEKPPLTLRGATKQLRSVAFSPDGLTLISAGDAEIIELWDVSKAIKHWDNEAARLIRVLSGHSDWVRTVAFSSDSQCFCTGSQDWHIMLWNIEKGKVGDFIEKPYDKMNITEVTGISEAQASELRVLGAIYSPT